MEYKQFKIKDNLINEKQLKELDYNNYTFIIIKDNCRICGLFSFFIHYLACISQFLNLGYIPIIDLCFPNIFNKFNSKLIKRNPWEFFFNQPYGYSLKDVKIKAKKIKYFKCKSPHTSDSFHQIYKNELLLDFYHNLAIKYFPIKNKIIKESYIVQKKLFNGSNNILGILARGTDYIYKKPRNHPVSPNIKLMFEDIKQMQEFWNYDYFFLATEDDIIRQKFINEFKGKLKILGNNINIGYNYKKKAFLYQNSKINGNIEYQKNYLINIIILSKCIDIVTARTGGAIGVFILSNGFRNSKVYYLGFYR